MDKAKIGTKNICIQQCRSSFGYKANSFSYYVLKQAKYHPGIHVEYIRRNESVTVCCEDMLNVKNNMTTVVFFNFTYILITSACEIASNIMMKHDPLIYYEEKSHKNGRRHLRCRGASYTRSHRSQEFPNRTDLAFN